MTMPSKALDASSGEEGKGEATFFAAADEEDHDDDDEDEDDEESDGLMFLDLSGNFIEGKAKANEKVKAKLSKTLGKVSGLMGKVSKKMGAVGEALDKGLASADKQLAPKKVPTKAGGSGALAKAIITKPPGGITLRRLVLAGCGLEARHIKLLAKGHRTDCHRSRRTACSALAD
jgi:hypothetical protein